MEQDNSITKESKWEQITYMARQKIEALLQAGQKTREIAKQLGYSKRTIERERKQGQVSQRKAKRDWCGDIIGYKEYYVYSAEISHEKHRQKSTAKGSKIKLGKDFEFAKAVARHIKEKRSPYSALRLIELEGKIKVRVCLKTLYNYIDRDYIPEITNKDLPECGKDKKREYKHTKLALNNLKGTSIEQRPSEVSTRTTFGHWELDSVEGSKGTPEALLVMSERLTRQELIFKIGRKTQDEVMNAINKLEQEMGSEKFRKTFKTVTCDNGCEFLNQAGLERSISDEKTKRFEVYYCHPYSAYERGTNENINKMIRRFIPKGTNIGDYTEKQIKEIQDYINSCPRLVLEGYPSNTRYAEHTA